MLFAAGKGVGAAVSFARQADLFQHGFGGLFRLPFGDAAHFEAESGVLQDGQVRQEGVVLEHQRDAAFFGRQGGDVRAVEQDAAAVGGGQSGSDVEQGGFAAAGTTEDGEQAAARDLEADAVGNGFAVELFADVLQFEHFQTALFQYAQAGQGGEALVAHDLAEVG